METARLIRTSTNDQGTRGTLSFGGATVNTLELPWRDNLSGVSCIPPGTYTCVWGMSPNLKRWTYRLQNVPNRAGVLIHSGNYAGDVTKGYVTHVQGCILPVSSYGTFRNKNGITQLAGWASAPALRKLESWGNKKPFILEVSWKS